MTPNGYNISHGGEGGFGVRRTNEEKIKIGLDSSARWANPEWKAKQIEASIAGRTEQGKENQRRAAKKMWENPEYREKMIKVQTLGSRRRWAAASPAQYEKFKDDI